MSERPRQEAIDWMVKAVARSKRRGGVRLPRQFARDQVTAARMPPLADLMQGGGEVRLKVLLTTLMLATTPPHSTKVSSRELAVMLDLRDPENAGTKRVNKAFNDLVKKGLIRREVKPGYVPESTVLHPAGDGEAWSDLKLAKPYISLPISLWQRGWIIALPGSALALLIILRELTAGRKNNTAWVDGIRKRQYGLSDDTWTKGTRQLCEAGLLEVTEKVYQSRGEPRRRNDYSLLIDQLAAAGPGDAPSDDDASK